MKIDVMMATSGDFHPDSRQFHLRSDDPKFSAVGMGHYVGSTRISEDLRIFRADILLTTQGEQKKNVTYLVDEKYVVHYVNVLSVGFTDKRRGELQNAAVEYALKATKFSAHKDDAAKNWVPLDSDKPVTLHTSAFNTGLDVPQLVVYASSRKPSMKPQRIFISQSGVTSAEKAKVLNHQGVKNLFVSGGHVSTQEGEDGTWYTIGRQAVWVSLPVDGVFKVIMADGEREATGEGKTVTAALDKASQSKFTKRKRK